MTLDQGNALFEGVGAFMTWLNFARLLKDREVRGVDWRVVAFWSAWGFWNLWYYWGLDQPVSWACGVILTVGNTAWVVLALRLRRAP